MLVSKKRKVESLYIEILNRCNAYCPYCYNDSDLSRSEMLSKEDLDRILKDCPSSVEAISISGGEPFLHPDLFKMIEVASDENREVQVITNGTLITKKAVLELKKLSPVIRLSLDSLNPQVYACRKGKDLFDAAWRGLVNLTDSGYPKVSVRINVDFDNAHEVEGMLKVFKNLGVGEVYLSLITPFGRGSQNNHLSYESNPNIVEHLCELRDELTSETFRVMYQGGVCITCPYSFSGTYEMPITVLINPLGDVYPCLMLSETEFCLGNIRNQKLKDILTGSRYEDFCDMMVKRCDQIDECRKCTYRHVCGGGCPAFALQKSGSLYLTDGECQLRRESIRQAIRGIRRI